ncbi:hypothetical protein TMUPMC115_1079 [Tetragenococcus muriaticus PMC-11-5]|uniref:Uncharacterized protein n=1 Tax=Tetragenococcus muriaticus PMC-11-5 TaxID=1302649 RepID=A0A091C2L9_9ENTE|nr:hypothetical protein TMUPMC115_1079 [Tetragenococcus muriaticus PMC-11-5]
MDGFWEIPVQLKKELLDGISQGIFSYDEKIQIEEYLADR